MTTFTREELLIIVAEEAAEVVQAATKCLRFGFYRDWPGYGRNDRVLANEFGQLAATIYMLNLEEHEVAKAANAQQEKIAKWKEYFLKNPTQELP